MSRLRRLRAGGVYDTAEILHSGIFKKKIKSSLKDGFCLEVFTPISLSNFIRSSTEKKKNSMIIKLYANLFIIWESYVAALGNMAFKETSPYTYKRKVYVGKMKRQANQNQGIMAQMMYYSK